MKQGYFVVRTYVSGQVGEKIKFFVPGEKPSKNRRKVSSDIRKQEQNEKQSERTLARILNATFKKGDVLVGLDYDERAYERLCEKAGVKSSVKVVKEARRIKLIRAAEEELRNCLRRVKRLADKLGIEVKVAAVTSDMDGETREVVRVHHHLVVNKEAAELFGKKWGKSKRVDYKKLDGNPDRTALAHYMLAQRLHIADSKSYITTRNVEYPKPKDRIVPTGNEITIPRGAQVLQRSEYVYGLSQYVRYLII